MNRQLESVLQTLSPGVHQRNFQGFDLLLIRKAWGELVVSQQGAQVLYYRPANARPVIWLSDRLKAPPAPFRGGVPVCWPWFADPPVELADQPFHGIARTNPWDWSIEALDNAGARLCLAPIKSLWPGLEPRITVRVEEDVLEIEIETINRGDIAVELTGALHTYLAVSDVNAIELHGLEDCLYADKVKQYQEDRQQGTVRFTAAFDRIYHSRATVQVQDPGWQRQLQIAKSGSGSTVVWNPGELAESMPDVGAEQQPEFVCVEAAMTRYAPVQLQPGARHRLGTVISIVEQADTPADT